MTAFLARLTVPRWGSTRVLGVQDPRQLGEVDHVTPGVGLVAAHLLVLDERLAVGVERILGRDLAEERLQ